MSNGHWGFGNYSVPGRGTGTHVLGMIMIPPRVEQPVEPAPSMPAWPVIAGSVGAAIAIPVVTWIRTHWTEVSVVLVLVGICIVLPLALLWIVVRVIRSAWR